jgi:glucans biosynthesis protein
MVVTASRGSLQGYRIVEAVPDGVVGHWRAEFDYTVDASADPVEMRCFLQAKGETLTETWMFQYHPF